MGRRRSAAPASVMKHVLGQSGVEALKGGKDPFATPHDQQADAKRAAERPVKTLGLVGAASQSNPALAQSLKIAKQQTPERKKKPLSLAKTVATPKKKPTGASPASAVAGALGSASGGSVRL